jgi:hypothetical protein
MKTGLRQQTRLDLYQPGRWSRDVSLVPRRQTRIVQIPQLHSSQVLDAHAIAVVLAFATTDGHHAIGDGFARDGTLIRTCLQATHQEGHRLGRAEFLVLLGAGLRRAQHHAES